MLNIFLAIQILLFTLVYLYVNNIGCGFTCKYSPYDDPADQAMHNYDNSKWMGLHYELIKDIRLRD